MKFWYFLLLTFFFLPLMVSGENSIPKAKHHIVKLRDTGLEPGELRMKADDSIVFFLNDSSEALATIEIDFRGQTAHCASSNAKVGEDQVLRSIKPFGPKDFTTTCFHSPGRYNVTVYGLRANPRGIKGMVIVE